MTAPEITYELTHAPADWEAAFDDPETLDWINDQLEAGNTWAWCTAIVTARIAFEGYTYEGNDCLGGCSYESREDFEKNGPIDDMKREARERLLLHLRVVVENGARCARLLAALGGGTDRIRITGWPQPGTAHDSRYNRAHVHAIKVWRATFEVSLAESKAVMDRVSGGYEVVVTVTTEQRNRLAAAGITFEDFNG